MQKRILNLSVAAYLSLSGFIKNFKIDERGLSGVVVAILLILVAVLAIVLIWTFLGDWLDSVWNNITERTNSIS